MTHMPVSQLIILAVIVAGFVIFGVSLLAVSLYANLGNSAGEPVERAVTPAKRANVHRLDH